MLDHCGQFGVGAEEVVADVAAVGDRVLLVLTIDDFVHALGQAAVGVLFQERVPVVAPDHLDDVPASAAKDRFEFLYYLPIAAHRAVEALEVAVYYPDEVVELFARREGERTQALGLVALAVAQKGPHLAVVSGLEAAVFEVAVEARLIDRKDWPQAHRHGRELPKVRHQPRVRIGGEATAFLQLAAEVFELVFVEAAFDEGAGVHAGGSVSLEVYLVAGMAVARGAEKVVVANLVEGR